MSDQDNTPTLRGLTYQEDGEFVALVLEMDIRGYGATIEEAVKEAEELVVTQLLSALEVNGGIESAMFPAEEKYFRMYDQVKLSELKALFEEQGQLGGSDLGVAGIRVPEPHVIAQLKGDVSLGHA